MQIREFYTKNLIKISTAFDFLFLSYLFWIELQILEYFLAMLNHIFCNRHIYFWNQKLFLLVPRISIVLLISFYAIDDLIIYQDQYRLTASHLYKSRQAIITFASRFAKSLTTSFPIPVFAPVTITTLFVNFSSPSYFAPPK